jgi:hypothetical protein
MMREENAKQAGMQPACFLGSDITLLARLERVEVVDAARARVNARQRAQQHTINPQVIVVNARHVLSLQAVDPQGQAAVIRACPARRSPIQLNGVGRIRQG